MIPTQARAIQTSEETRDNSKYPSYARRAWHAAKRMFATAEPRHGDTRILPTVTVADVVGPIDQVSLQSLAFVDGNVSPLEILVIASLVSVRHPRCIFEVGTFNGNTTLQLALNAPADCKVYMLDLPYEEVQTINVLDKEDVKYTNSFARIKRRFHESTVANKVVELFCDSATFDFRKAINGDQIDFAFIDGSHSYEYVKNDTQRVLKELSPNGVILWHDYHPFWTGVCEYLNELCHTLPIRHIEGTTLGYLRLQNAEDLQGGFAETLTP